MLLRIKEEDIVINTDQIRWMYYDKEDDVTNIYMGVNNVQVKGDVTFGIMESWELLRDIQQDKCLDDLKRRLSL